jgi:hypothetical protein
MKPNTDRQEQQIAREFRSKIEAELQPGERINWLGQPMAGRLGFRTALPSLVLGIVLIPTVIILTPTAGVVGLLACITGSGVLWLTLLIIMSVLLPAIALLASPYFAARRARRVVYLLTNRRAIVLDGSRRGAITVRTFEAHQLTNVQCRPHADHAGDLVFCHDPYTVEGEHYSREIGFLAVPGVRVVGQMVRELAAPAGAAIPQTVASFAGVA